MNDEFALRMYDVDIMIHNEGISVLIDGEEVILKLKNVTTYNTYSVIVVEREHDKTLWQVVVSEDDEDEDELTFYRLDDA